MKTKTLYTCEICNTDYADKENAKRCEKEHSKSVGITDFRINAHEKYPHRIEIEFLDGTRKWYKW